MFQVSGVTAAFEYVCKANNIPADIGIGIREAVTHPRLCGKIDYNFGPEFIKDILKGLKFDYCFIDISFFCCILELVIS